MGPDWPTRRGHHVQGKRQARVDARPAAGELNLAIGGTTYPFKDILKKHGFAFNNIVNDQPLQLWLRVEPEAQPDMDADDLEALFDQYGFEVDRYDGVEGSEDEDA